jgi:hypothetical protein
LGGVQVWGCVDVQRCLFPLMVKNDWRSQCVCNRYLGEMITLPLPSNGRIFWLHHSGQQLTCDIAACTSRVALGYTVITCPRTPASNADSSSRMAYLCRAGVDTSSGLECVQTSFHMVWVSRGYPLSLLLMVAR